MRKITAAVLITTTCLGIGGQEADLLPVGKASHSTGQAWLRAKSSDRWTPLVAGTRLLQGDTLRTGPNELQALELELGSGARLLIGPRSRLELKRKDSFRLHEGAVLLSRGRSGAVVIEAAGGRRMRLTLGKVQSVQDRQLKESSADPAWAKRFRETVKPGFMGAVFVGKAPNEELLKITDYSLSVRIEDQLARTTIEESFENPAGQDLSGRFYFPLPPGATLDSFAIWIDGTWILADTVSLAHASRLVRELPTAHELGRSGKSFEAMIFPVKSRAKTRIRFSYSEILDFERSRLRYRASLRGPAAQSAVDKIRIRFELRSKDKILRVWNPSHALPFKTEAQSISCDVELAAASTSASSDFTVEILLQRQSNLRTSARREGDEGFFMLSLTPHEAAWEAKPRRLTPDGRALDVLILADSSASMDPDERLRQRDFILALLELLGKKDRFRLMCIDSHVSRMREIWAKPDAKGKEDAAAFLEQRTSLGWTDLELGLSEAIKDASGQRSTIIYVGDGIGTSGEGDPRFLIGRLKRLGKTTNARFFVVNPAKQQDESVLRGLASIGRGTVWSLADNPSKTAFELLFEVIEPVVTELDIQIEGVESSLIETATGRILLHGDSRVLLGRYRASSVTDNAKIRTRYRTRKGELIERILDFPIPEDGEGNPLLPVLWASERIASLRLSGDEHKEEMLALARIFGILSGESCLVVLPTEEERIAFAVGASPSLSDWPLAPRRSQQAVTRMRKAKSNARRRRLALRGRIFDELFPIARSAAQRDRSVETSQLPAIGILIDSRKPPRILATWQPRVSLSAQGSARGSTSDVLVPLIATSLHVSSSSGYGFPAFTKDPERTELVPTFGEAQARVLATLDRSKKMSEMAGGISITMTAGVDEAQAGVPESHWVASGLFAKNAWLARENILGQEHIEEGFDGQERHVLSRSFMLGTKRRAQPGDSMRWPFPFMDRSWPGSFSQLARHEAHILRKSDKVTVISFKVRNAGTQEELRLHIDTTRGLLLREESFTDGILASSLRFEDFVKIGNVYIASTIRKLGPEGRLLNRYGLDIRSLDDSELQEEFRAAARQCRRAVFLQTPAATESEFAHPFRLAREQAKMGDARRAWEFWKLASVKITNRPGRRWLRLAFLKERRPLDLYRRAVFEMAGALGRHELGSEQEAEGLFLALHLITEASRELSAEEAKKIIDALRPLFFEDGAHSVWRQKTWRLLQIANLEASGQTRQALGQRARLTREHPGDIEVVLGHVTALARTGRLVDAMKLCGREAMRNTFWRREETERLHEEWTRLSRDLDNEESMLASTRSWFRSSPGNVEACRRYSSTLLLQGRHEEYDSWILERLRKGVSPAFVTRSPAQQNVTRAQLKAAIDLALGRGWQFLGGRIERRWIQELTKLATGLCKGDSSSFHLARRILDHHQFRKLENYRAVMQAFRKDLLRPKRLTSLGTQDLDHCIRFLTDRENEIPSADLQTLLTHVQERWQKSKRRGDRKILATLVLLLMDRQGKSEEALAFLRQQFELAKQPGRSSIAVELLNRLVHARWDLAIEEEVLHLLESLDEPKEAISWASTQLERMRISASRTTVTLKQRRRQARDGLGRSFMSIGRKASDAAAPWLLLQGLSLSAIASYQQDPQLRLTDVLLLDSLLEPGGSRRLFVERCAQLATFLATRRDQDDVEVESLLALFRKRMAEKSPLLDWRTQIFRLLSALDRKRELESSLHSWITEDPEQSSWRIELAHLLAERGKFEEATRILDPLAKAGELESPEYAAMADWLGAVGKQERSDDAMRRHFLVMSPRELRGQVDDQLHKLVQQGAAQPEAEELKEVNPDLISAAAVLLSIAEHPHAQLGRIVSLYRMTKSSDLLASLSEGVLGHPTRESFHFLSALPQILDEISDLASCKSLVDELHLLIPALHRAHGKRSLHLLSFLVSRRMMELAGDSNEKLALEHLNQAFRLGGWLEGERGQMAAFLAGLGRMINGGLSSAQLRQLRQLAGLFEHAKNGSSEKLLIAMQRSRCLWAYSRRSQAFSTLGEALSTYQDTKADSATAMPREEIETYLSWARRLGKFREAEQVLDKERRRQGKLADRRWIDQRLFETHIAAFEHGGLVSLGEGRALFDNIHARLQPYFSGWGRRQLPSSFRLFLNLHRIAGKKDGFANAGKILANYANNDFLEVLGIGNNDRQELIAHMADALAELEGPGTALAFLIARLENEARWVRVLGQEGWKRHAFTLAKFRHRAADSPALEKRLLAICKKNLLLDLASPTATEHAIYNHRYRHFWTERSGDFASAAMDYLLEDPMSRKRVRRVARYLFDGLGMKNRAIAVLETGRTNKVLDDKGQTQLLSWLLDQERYGQALPLLESMVHAQPDALQLRTLQMTTHARAGDLDAARSLFQETVRSLEVQQRWNEENSLAMAKAAMELGLHVQAIVQQRKAIEHHLRTVGRKEQGDERLSFHLSTLAESYLAQGAFALAVKMSARAVLAWGDNVFRRKRREKDVTALLRNIKDLPSWWHEEKAGFDAETGIIQKSIALLLIERNETRKALDMLRQARQRNPRDIEIHERLLRASQQAKDLTSSCEALLSWIKVEPKQLTLYTQLGSELESMGDYQAAERAYSSTVELEPEQREGHEIIAKRREQQKRFDDAAVQWQRILRIDSRLPDAWLSLARVQIRSGAKAKAKKTLEHLLSLRWEKQHGAVKLKARLLLDLLDTEEPR